MNLRRIHAVLILLSAILAVVFGVWCLNNYTHHNDTMSLFAAITAFLVSLGLLLYDSWFLRKTRMMR
jgi:hypothetical protein